MKRAYNYDLESSFLLSSMMKVFSMKGFATDLKCKIRIRKSKVFFYYSLIIHEIGENVNWQLTRQNTLKCSVLRIYIFDFYRSRLCYSLTLDKHQQAPSVKAGKGETIRSSVVQQIKMYTEDH